MPLDPDQRFEPAPGVLFQEVHGEIVLLDLEGEQYFGLNEVGARIWQLLGEGRTVDAVLRTLLDEYEVARERLAPDLETLCRELVQRGLLRPADDAHGGSG